MTMLGKSDINKNAIDAIQSSLPDGQAIRHVVTAFATGQDESGQSSVISLFWLVVTDSLLAFRHLIADWELTTQQIQLKTELEGELVIQAAPKTLNLSKKLLNKINNQVNENSSKQNVNYVRRYSDHQILQIVDSRLGPLKLGKHEVTFSNDFLIRDVRAQSFQEVKTAPYLQSYFADWGHQVENVGFFELFFPDGSSQDCCSFFEGIHDIFNHIRDVKLGIVETGGNPSRVTKCLNCGSTELTISGTQVICDFCQSKFSR